MIIYLPLCLAVCALADPSVPLFLWSGKKYFGNAKEQHREVNGLLHVDEFIPDFMNTFGGKKNLEVKSPVALQDSLMNYISKTEQITPEVVVAFIYSKLDSADAARQSGAYSSNTKNVMSLSFLKNALAKSTSSLIVPHVLVDTSTISTSEQLADEFSKGLPKPEIVELQLNGELNGMSPEADDNVAGCKALMGHLNDNEWMFSNLVTDLIMIKADDFRGVEEECVISLMQRVNSLTSGHFVAMLTADTPRTDIVKVFPTPSKTHLMDFSFQGLSDQKLFASQGQKFIIMASDTSWPGVRYLSSNILFGLSIGALFLLTVLCGASCLLSIQTPQRLSSRPYHIGKQS